MSGRYDRVALQSIEDAAIEGNRAFAQDMRDDQRCVENDQ
jgi:hypothetical protein